MNKVKIEKFQKIINKDKIDLLIISGHCVFIMDQKVYDVTDYLYDHPGGYEILENIVGTDAYDQFLAQKHSEIAFKQIEKYQIGTLIKDKSNKIQKLNKFSKIVRILYGTQFGNSKKLATRLLFILKKVFPQTSFLYSRLDKFDPKNLSKETCILIIISTMQDGNPPPMGKIFFKWLNKTVEKKKKSSDLKSFHFSIFGCCDSIYNINFNIVAQILFKNLCRIGGKPLLPLGKGDKNTLRFKNQISIQTINFEKWIKKLWKQLNIYLKKPENYLDENVKKKKSNKLNFLIEKTLKKNKNNSFEGLNNMISSKKKKIKKTYETRKMITPIMHKKMIKEGYKLLSSHSAVKLCRWTKIMLHDRGGCYKHVFYGIMSYRCMETTPNLACANRCIFCWRHHTNPISKDWRWMKDSPEILLEQSLKYHYKLINEIKNSSQVKKVYFKKAHLVKHCALSLVGEPIMYPNIQDYVDLLHNKSISTFMVTNGQFPDKILNLGPITQFYISVDSATKKSLQKIDRPLFKDFWERFLKSITILKEKSQRTVYRLTLMKKYNMKECANYASLISFGKPSFIEIKGMTFYGKSNGYKIEMNNIPWHKEVLLFSEKIITHISDDYELACEHKHSCCVLIAKKKYKIKGKWHTWIDYDKFEQLIFSGKDFNEYEYMSSTPNWAVFGLEKNRFNPRHVWFQKEIKIYQRSQMNFNKSLKTIRNKVYKHV